MQSAGSLKLIPLTNVLRRIFDTGQTGILEVKNGEVVRKFYIKDRRIDSCASNVTGEQLSQLLIWHGKLNSTELKTLYAEAIAKQQAFGGVLLDKNILSLNKIEMLLKIKIEDSLTDSLGWDDGRFRFVNDTEFYKGAVQMSIPLESTFEDASFQVQRYKKAKKKMVSEKTRFWIEEGKDINEQIKTPQTELLLESLVEGLSVEEMVLEFYGRRVFIYTQLMSWFENGFLRKENRGKNRVRENSTLSAQQFMVEIKRYQNQKLLKEAFLLCRRVMRILPSKREFADKLFHLEELLMAKLVRKYLVDYCVPRKTEESTLSDLSSLDSKESLIYRKVDGCWDMLSLVYLVPIRPIDALLVIDNLSRRNLISW